MESNSIASSQAQDLAGKAILFEIGAKSGILEYIEHESTINTSLLSKKLNLQPDFLNTYLDLLVNLNLLKKATANDNHGNHHYEKTSQYQIEKNKIGYLAWGLISCAPLLENTKAFTHDFNQAVNLYHRKGEHVARTSKWMGEIDFYPHAEEVIIKLNPQKVVDLGSGTCGLLIRLAQQIKNFKGVGIDLSKEACNKAAINIKELGLDKQCEVVVSPIQNLIENNQYFQNADVVHAGFVFHDLLPEEEETLDKLLATIHKVAPKAALVVVDAIPFSQNESERAFSGAFTFLHRFFMGRKLLSENEWTTKLTKAGFKQIKIEKLGISGGRIFVANG